MFGGIPWIWYFKMWHRLKTPYFVVIFRVGVDVLYRRAICTSGILPVKSFSRPHVLLDETDKHFSHKLLLYFAFFVKWVKSLTYLIFASQGLRSVLLIFTLGIGSLIFEVTQWQFICNAASGSCNQSERALQKAHVL